MSDRLDLQINVLEKSSQRALALSSLTTAELIAAILQEFRQDEDLDYMSDRVEDYQLVRAEDATPLPPDSKLGALASGAQLSLVERVAPPPTGTQRTTHALYLREQATGNVYRLYWTPALIGRPDQGHHSLAVNLETHPNGLRVSRRHAQITEEKGRYYVESLSPNPTVLLKPAMAQPRILALGEKVEIEHDDILWLDRSEIKLKFIVRAL